MRKAGYATIYAGLAVLLIITLFISVRVGAVGLSYDKILGILAKRLGMATTASFTHVEEQVFLDLVVQRHRGRSGHGSSQPFSPDRAIPRTKWRWAITNRMIIGAMLTSAPAIISGHLPTNWP